MSIELNTGQVYATYDLEHWWHYSTKQIFEVNGAAGTGKTTVIKYFIDRIGLDLKDVLFVSYMGKAVSQMNRNGLPARTIHSSIYDCKKVVDRDENNKIIILPNGNPKTKYEFQLKEKLENNPKLIVIDEGFMVPEKIALDLLSFGVPIVVLGDTHQLPPVFGNPFFLNNPDVTLTEIMRQKEGDPIIYLSQKLLNKEDLKEGVYGKSAVIRKSNLTDYTLKAADIIITGTNRLRAEVNTIFRENFLAIDDLSYPHYHEKIICRKNNWSKKINVQGDLYLTNGLAGYVDYVDRESYNGKSIKIDFRPDFTNKYFKNIKLSIPFINTPPGKNKDIGFIGNELNSFEYSYAITTHLSQGSQYPNVVFMKEHNFFDNEDDYYRLLYTAVTRASESIVYVF